MTFVNDTWADEWFVFQVGGKIEEHSNKNRQFSISVSIIVYCFNFHREADRILNFV